MKSVNEGELVKVLLDDEMQVYEKNCISCNVTITPNNAGLMMLEPNKKIMLPAFCDACTRSFMSDEEIINQAIIEQSLETHTKLLAAFFEDGEQSKVVRIYSNMVQKAISSQSLNKYDMLLILFKLREVVDKSNDIEDLLVNLRNSVMKMQANNND